MKSVSIDERRMVAVAQLLVRLPRKMIRARECDALIDCVLYELAHEACFNLSYIAYFAYNPDFKLCKGIGALDQGSFDLWHEDVWQNVDTFRAHVRQSSFYQQVRHFNVQTNESDISEILNVLRSYVGDSQARSHIIELPYGNKGIVLYSVKVEELQDEYVELADGVSLLGFCPLG